MTAADLYVRLFLSAEKCGDAIQEGHDSLALHEAGKLEQLARDLQGAIVREHKLRLAEAAAATLAEEVAGLNFSPSECASFAVRLQASCNREIGLPDDPEDLITGDVPSIPPEFPAPGRYRYDHTARRMVPSQAPASGAMRPQRRDCPEVGPAPAGANVRA